MQAKVDNPAFPKGEPLDVGFALVENGSTVEVTEEDELRFYGRFGYALQDATIPGVKFTGAGSNKPSDVVKELVNQENVSAEPTAEQRAEQLATIEGTVPEPTTSEQEGGE